MALSQRQLSELKRIIDAEANQTEKLAKRTGAAIAALYAGNMYSATAVAAITAQAADASTSANQLAAGLTAAYLAAVSGQVTGAAVGVPNLPLPPIRNGVPLTTVFERPVKLYRRRISQGVSPAEAFQQARQYADQIAAANIRLAQRETSRSVMRRLERDLGVTGYRRVVHPELSRTGTCGLCIAASDAVYKTSELMPIHDRCKCETMPIFGAEDPGNSLNNLTFKDLYGAAAAQPNARRASGTHAFDLKRVRYQVNQHGEWGPVLTVKGHKFTGPDEIAAAA